ncbi:MAG: TIGR02301 family protein [Rhizobiaceae bacterium]
MTITPKPSLAVALVVATLLYPAVAVRADNVPYEKQLLRLSEILGSIHYLRSLCGEKDGGWRDQMEALLEAENPEPVRRARMIASFNRGYRTYGSVYKTCTESATAAIARYMKEGETLSKEVVVRFGD